MRHLCVLLQDRQDLPLEVSCSKAFNPFLDRHAAMPPPPLNMDTNTGSATRVVRSTPMALVTRCSAVPSSRKWCGWCTFCTGGQLLCPSKCHADSSPSSNVMWCPMHLLSCTCQLVTVPSYQSCFVLHTLTLLLTSWPAWSRNVVFCADAVHRCEIRFGAPTPTC